MNKYSNLFKKQYCIYFMSFSGSQEVSLQYVLHLTAFDKGKPNFVKRSVIHCVRKYKYTPLLPQPYATLFFSSLRLNLSATNSLSQLQPAPTNGASFRNSKLFPEIIIIAGKVPEEVGALS